MLACASQTVRMHVGIFLAMSIVLLCLVVWFIGELAAADAATKEEEEKKKE